MKIAAILFFIGFLFSGNTLSGQTEPDTCPPVNHHAGADSLGRIGYSDLYDTDGNDLGPKPIIEAEDTIQLCVCLFPLSKKAYKEFSKALENDGIEVICSGFSNEVEKNSLFIKMTFEQFRKIFNGIAEYKKTPASSFDGYLWQLFIKSYSLPEKYRHIIKSIMLPDPQIGRC